MVETHADLMNMSFSRSYEEGAYERWLAALMTGLRNDTVVLKGFLLVLWCGGYDLHK